jgi:hypothetical protein
VCLSYIQDARFLKVKQSLQVDQSLTPHSTVLLEKLTGLQPVKKFPEFYGTQKFITAFTSVRHLFLS